MTTTRTKLIVGLLDNVVGAAYAYSHGPGGWTHQKLALPANSTVSLGSTSETDERLFVSVTGYLAPTTYWLADAGWEVPATYGEVFAALARHDVMSTELATRLSAAAGFRNLVAHQYGVLDWRRVHAFAASDLTALEAFCSALAARAAGGE